MVKIEQGHLNPSISTTRVEQNQTRQRQQLHQSHGFDESVTWRPDLSALRGKDLNQLPTKLGSEECVLPCGQRLEVPRLSARQRVDIAHVLAQIPEAARVDVQRAGIALASRVWRNAGKGTKPGLIDVGLAKNLVATYGRATGRRGDVESSALIAAHCAEQLVHLRVQELQQRDTVGLNVRAEVAELTVSVAEGIEQPETFSHQDVTFEGDDVVVSDPYDVTLTAEEAEALKADLLEKLRKLGKTEDELAAMEVVFDLFPEVLTELAAVFAELDVDALMADVDSMTNETSLADPEGVASILEDLAASAPAEEAVPAQPTYPSDTEMAEQLQAGQRVEFEYDGQSYYVAKTGDKYQCFDADGKIVDGDVQILNNKTAAGYMEVGGIPGIGEGNRLYLGEDGMRIGNSEARSGAELGMSADEPSTGPMSDVEIMMILQQGGRYAFEFEGQRYLLTMAANGRFQCYGADGRCIDKEVQIANDKTMAGYVEIGGIPGVGKDQRLYVGLDTGGKMRARIGGSEWR